MRLKYLLLMLPFMWGCAEKKEPATSFNYPHEIIFPAGLYNADTVAKRIREGRANFDTLVRPTGDTVFVWKDSIGAAVSKKFKQVTFIEVDHFPVHDSVDCQLYAPFTYQKK